MSLKHALSSKVSRTSFQKSHHVDKTNRGVCDAFLDDRLPSVAAYPVKEKLKLNMSNPRKADDTGEILSEVCAEIDPKLHLLLGVSHCLDLPEVSVKDEENTRIAWTHNIGSSIIYSCSLSDKSFTYLTMDQVTQDMLYAFFMEKRDVDAEYRGNVLIAEKWSKYIPSIPVYVREPWTFSYHSQWAFPILMTNGLHIKYLLRLNICDLLRVESRQEDGTWAPVPRNKVMDYINTASSAITQPEFWGDYILKDENGVKDYLCKDHIYHMRQIIEMDYTNEEKLERTIDPVVKCSHPMTALMWAAKNITAEKEHCLYSNYTTNATDVYEGFDPVYTSSLHNGDIQVFPPLKSYHFNVGLPPDSSVSLATVAGYHMHPFACNPIRVDCDTSAILDGKLSCKISGKSDVYNPRLKTDDLFLLHVRAMIIREVKFSFVDNKWEVSFDDSSIEE